MSEASQTSIENQKPESKAGILIPIEVLDDASLTLSEKLIISFLRGAELGSFLESIAYECRLPFPTVKRSVSKLKNLGRIKISLRQGRKSLIKISAVSDRVDSPKTDNYAKLQQVDQNEDQNDPPKTDNCPKLLQVDQNEDQNDPIIIYNNILYNNNNNNCGRRIKTIKPEKLLIGEAPTLENPQLSPALIQLFESQGKIEAWPGKNVWISEKEYESLLKSGFTEEEMSASAQSMFEWSTSIDTPNNSSVPQWISFRKKRDHAKTMRNQILRMRSWDLVPVKVANRFEWRKAR